MVQTNALQAHIIKVLINSQYASNMHANKQLFNSENWSLK